MADSQNDGKNSLLGLFSTRASHGRASSEGLQPSVRPAGPAEQPATAAPTPTTNASEGVITPPVQQQVRAAAAKTQEMSPIASTVMREARRELGSDLTLQQQMTSASATEQVIAQAVDRVIRKRGEVLDDIERVNIIIHLQKDLVG